MSKRKFDNILEINDNSKKQRIEERVEGNQENLNVGKMIILTSTQELSTQELRTLFLYAAISCDIKELEECLNRGININYKGRMKKIDGKMVGPTPILIRLLNSDNNFNDVYEAMKFIIDYSNNREKNDPNWKKLNINCQSKLINCRNPFH